MITTLTDFRSYASATLPIQASTVVLHGPNGAGMTNRLEALRLFMSGRRKNPNAQGERRR